MTIEATGIHAFLVIPKAAVILLHLFRATRIRD